jgi:GDP-6-deoxy-D-talose 4-dehydrogenase
MIEKKKVLLTGSSGFTGLHLCDMLCHAGYEVAKLQSNLCDKAALAAEIWNLRPSLVIHLGGMSFAGGSDHSKLYSVNVLGTQNLLAALAEIKSDVKKVILASSATIYGTQNNIILDEKLEPRPVNHYGSSKFSMEIMASIYMKDLPIIITRPFNYSGVGQHEIFVIPKIVRAFANGDSAIELGNLNVHREFNDVRDVCAAYISLLEAPCRNEKVNICSGNPVSLAEVIMLMESISGYRPEIKINQDFVRVNEIPMLVGSNERLKRITGLTFKYSINQTLSWMYSISSQ